MRVARWCVCVCVYQHNGMVANVVVSIKLYEKSRVVVGLTLYFQCLGGEGFYRDECGWSANDDDNDGVCARACAMMSVIMSK